MSEHSSPPRWLPFVVLGIGLSAVSCGAIFARFAQSYGLPSLAIAALRLGLAALIITPVALWQSRRALLALNRRQTLLTLGAGFFLALHFATWISSLEYTSVASSTALVTTNLLWIGIASFVLFGERSRQPNRDAHVLVDVNLIKTESKCGAHIVKPIQNDAIRPLWLPSFHFLL